MQKHKNRFEPLVAIRADQTGITRSLPDFDFADTKWRKKCMKKCAQIPSGYTYLGQLIGHDAGHSLDLAMIPHATSETGLAKQQTVAFDIIPNKLAFETLYGPGPVLMYHVFDPYTFLFRIGSDDQISQSIKGEMVRALYDVRNRDTVMLHQIATAWMKYHNKIALELDESLPDATRYVHHNAASVYQSTRKHVLDTWHRVIKKDFLKNVLHPSVRDLQDDDFRAFPPISDTTLQSGIFRVFHCMPRKAYLLQQEQQLRELRADLPHLSVAEKESDGWRIDLSAFFRGDHDQNKSGISASTTADLKELLKRDFQTAREHHPQRWNGDSVQETIEHLTELGIPTITVDAMASEITKQASIFTQKGIASDQITNGPLYIALMIEGHLRGENGSLGPIASAMLRKALNEHIKAITLPDPPLKISSLPQHSTMLDVINFVEGKKHDG